MPDVYQDDKPTQYNTSHTFFDPKKNLNKKLPFKYHSETEKATTVPAFEK
jgi:hypothetical protein